MNMEHTSDMVAFGRFISEDTYKKNKHELEIITDNECIVLDYFDRKSKIIHEIKKSDKLEYISIWQLKFYLFVLERNGLNGVKGILDYPKLRKKTTVELTDEDRKRLHEAEEEIQLICGSKKIPEPVMKKFCRKCSYFDLCYI
jgi:CRISPR-associated exonuclease Cas4